MIGTIAAFGLLISTIAFATSLTLQKKTLDKIPNRIYSFTFGFIVLAFFLITIMV